MPLNTAWMGADPVPAWAGSLVWVPVWAGSTLLVLSDCKHNAACFETPGKTLPFSQEVMPEDYVSAQLEPNTREGDVSVSHPASLRVQEVRGEERVGLQRASRDGERRLSW